MKKRLLSIKSFTTFILLAFVSFTFAQDAKPTEGTLVEKTSYDGVLNTNIADGFLLKTASFHYYVIDETVKQKLTVTNPEIVVTKIGKKLTLTIQGLDKPLKCHRESDVVDGTINGAFTGWDGSTTFNLLDGQVWQQDESGIKSANLYKPKVLIYRTGDGYKMKVEGIEELLLVKKIK